MLSHSIRCYKHKTDVQREISSFRITPSEEYFNSLISTTFWPDGTLVKEFIPKVNTNNLAQSMPTIPTRN